MSDEKNTYSAVSGSRQPHGNNVHAEDDAAEIVILRPEDVNPEDFGLDSIRKAVPIYLGKY